MALSIEHLHRVRHAIGVDRRVFSGLLAKIVLVAFNAVSGFVVAFTLTADDQGLFYLFASILALRTFFELGAGISIIQIAAHSREEGSKHVERELIVVVERWMRLVSTAFGVVVGLVGSLFLAYKGYRDAGTQLAWLSFVAITAAQISAVGRLSVIEGADHVVEYNYLQVVLGLIRFVVQLVLLVMGATLFSFSIASIVAYIAQEFYLRRDFPWLYRHTGLTQPERITHFRGELFFLLKRSSQTYLTGYFVSQMQQPICFQLLGAKASAQLGFTQAVLTAAVGLAAVWLSVSFPAIANEVARKRMPQAKKMFVAKWLQTLGFSLLGVVGGVVGIYFLRYIPRLSDRLMNVNLSLVLAIGLLVQNIALGLTYWPRAFKVEPFVAVAYTQMVATPLLLWFGASYFGMMGIVSAILISWIVGMIGILIVVRPYWEVAAPEEQFA